MCVLQREFQLFLDCVAQRPGAAQGRVEFPARLESQRAQNVIAVAIALVNGWGSRSRSAGYGPHRERLFAAAGPQPRGCAENALFQVRIGMPWHCSFLPTARSLLALCIINVVY